VEKSKKSSQRIKMKIVKSFFTSVLIYLVPLDAVEGVAVQVVAAGQVSCFPALDIRRNTHRDLREAVQL
jgi:hypothetical protein